MTDPLRLRAEDAQDIATISSFVQDAVVPLTEMAYQPEERRFILVLNRFRWENCPEPGGNCDCYERILSGLHFDHVRAVKTRGIDRSKRDGLLELLAVEAAENVILLHFAGGGVIRLEVERIACRLHDLGESWPTQWRPNHPVEDVA